MVAWTIGLWIDTLTYVLCKLIWFFWECVRQNQNQNQAPQGRQQLVMAKVSAFFCGRLAKFESNDNIFVSLEE